MQEINVNQSFPQLITPSSEKTDLGEYLREKERELSVDLKKHGAILFRGFDVGSIEAFDKLVTCFSNQPIPYMFRTSPRFSLSKRVYVSTTYPESRAINLHSESSYSYAWGQKIIFCCIKAAAEHGETPIADNRKVLDSLRPELTDKFETKGVIYQRNISPEIGMPWQEVFQTENPEEVRVMCQENNIQFKFVTRENLVLRWRKPAIYKHPSTGQRTWFNHAFFFNKYSLLEEMGLSADDDSIDEFLPFDTYFGDGTPITYQEYSEIKSAYEKQKVLFPWNAGDVLLLDNMLTAHGRSPYKGERQIVVAIAEPISDKELGNDPLIQL